MKYFAFLLPALLPLSALACGQAGGEETASSGAALDRGSVVISQVFTGAGGAYDQNFVELLNKTASSVSLDGLSLQTANQTSDLGTLGNLALTGSIPANAYFLVALGNPAAAFASLPQADQSASVNIGGAGGKVGLFGSTAGAGCGGVARCGSKALDLVGYGGASDFEGAGGVGSLDGSHAALRNGDGCTDADNNSADFALAPPAPRNSQNTKACPPPPVKDAGGGADAAGPVPPVKDPPLGKEPPFDAGSRRDAGDPTAGAGGSSDNCAVNTVGASPNPAPLMGLLFAALFVLGRVRSRRK